MDTIVMFHGALDVSKKKTTSAVLSSVERSTRLTLDLSDVQSVDSSFFASLVSIFNNRRKELEDARIRVVANEKIQRLFHIVGLDRCVELHAQRQQEGSDAQLVDVSEKTLA